MLHFWLWHQAQLNLRGAAVARRPCWLGDAVRQPRRSWALTAEPSIAAVLPCNVVVRALDDDTTAVEAFDPDAMMGLADNAALDTVAADAKQRLTAALAALDSAQGEK